MFTLSQQLDFKAHHYLIGGDWGAENTLHAHSYRLELTLESDQLDQNGFVADIVEIEQHLDALLQSYSGITLNDLPEFEDLNPTMEHFARILCISLAKSISTRQLKSITVRLWESESAWASYLLEF